jgi:hypothetical protein
MRGKSKALVSIAGKGSARSLLPHFDQATKVTEVSMFRVVRGERGSEGTVIIFFLFKASKKPFDDGHCLFSIPAIPSRFL